MKTAEKACMAEGFVSPSFIDVRTGARVPFRKRHNTLSYMSAEAMAAAFGGDPSYIPSKMGFIYGDSNAGFSGGISRVQTWKGLKEELSSAGADVQVVPFSYSPTLGGEKTPSGSSSSWSDDEGDYTNIITTGSNAITFHAVSNSQDGGVIDRSVAFSTDDVIYQAVLLGIHEGRHYVLSRVSLYDEELKKYLAKPRDFEVALDWTVVFR